MASFHATYYKFHITLTTKSSIILTNRIGDYQALRNVEQLQFRVADAPGMDMLLLTQLFSMVAWGFYTMIDMTGKN